MMNCKISIPTQKNLYFSITTKKDNTKLTILIKIKIISIVILTYMQPLEIKTNNQVFQISILTKELICLTNINKNNINYVI